MKGKTRGAGTRHLFFLPTSAAAVAPARKSSFTLPFKSAFPSLGRVEVKNNQAVGGAGRRKQKHPVPSPVVVFVFLFYRLLAAIKRNTICGFFFSSSPFLPTPLFLHSFLLLLDPIWDLLLSTESIDSIEKEREREEGQAGANDRLSTSPSSSSPMCAFIAAHTKPASF